MCDSRRHVGPFTPRWRKRDALARHRRGVRWLRRTRCGTGGCGGLGDRVERWARALRLDRVAGWFERRTGRPCGCQARKLALNRWRWRDVCAWLRR